jgi:hypothetical protein
MFVLFVLPVLVLPVLPCGVGAGLGAPQLAAEVERAI